MGADRDARERAKSVAAFLGSALNKIVLAHNVAQAIPWLIATVLSFAVVAYGLVSSNALLLGGAVAAAAGSVLILLISFFTWYFKKRREGWRRKAKENETDQLERELERKVSDRMALALKLGRDLSLHRLEISNPDRLLEETSAWLTARLWPALRQLSPEIGLGMLKWDGGLYSLPYDAAVPEIIRSILPKRTNREFSRCLDGLQLVHHHVPLDEGMGRSDRTWLVAFPSEEFDLAIDNVFSVGAGIVADAWRGLDGGQFPDGA